MRGPRTGTNKAQAAKQCIIEAQTAMSMEVHQSHEWQDSNPHPSNTISHDSRKNLICTDHQQKKRQDPWFHNLQKLHLVLFWQVCWSRKAMTSLQSLLKMVHNDSQQTIVNCTDTLLLGPEHICANLTYPPQPPCQSCRGGGGLNLAHTAQNPANQWLPGGPPSFSAPHVHCVQCPPSTHTFQKQRLEMGWAVPCRWGASCHPPPARP